MDKNDKTESFKGNRNLLDVKNYNKTITHYDKQMTKYDNKYKTIMTNK